ncbi:methionyl-tRNA formyltransferase [Thermoproteota archaeon]
MTTTRKLIFMGSPEFAIPTLKELYLLFPKNLIGVFTKPDAPKGRGQIMTMTPVKEWAQAHNIPVWSPKTKEEMDKEIIALNPDVILVAAYGMIIPKIITDNYFCINTHPSLLPKYRGASPIQAALLTNDTTTGITLMKINDTLDAGDILYQERISILEGDNFESLHNRLAENTARICAHYLGNSFFKGIIQTVQQNHDMATYCPMIQSEDYLLDLNADPKTNIGKIRAFSPKPGAYVIQNNRQIKILEARIIDGKLDIIKVKPEGKTEMFYSDYLLAHPPIVQQGVTDGSPC